MERQIDSLNFKIVEGARREHDAVIYALSTCAFCHRAIEYLKNHNLHFRYIYLDLISTEIKKAVKRELAEKFDNVVVFPILVVDDQRAYSGFTESVWARALEIE